MKSIVLIASTIISFLFHAGGIAESHFIIDQNQVFLKFEMDRNEFRHYRINIDCSKNTMFNICASKYILSRSNLKINDKNVEFEFESSSIYNDHIIFNFKSIESYNSVNNIQIKNNCFYEINPEFKNRVTININNLQKSFLLTKDKDSISLK